MYVHSSFCSNFNLFSQCRVTDMIGSYSVPLLQVSLNVPTKPNKQIFLRAGPPAGALGPDTRGTSYPPPCPPRLTNLTTLTNLLNQLIIHDLADYETVLFLKILLKLHGPNQLHILMHL